MKTISHNDQLLMQKFERNIELYGKAFIEEEYVGLYEAGVFLDYLGIRIEKAKARLKF